ncbi:MAG: GNAT family N-acetyltransferase [Bacillota bacterium]
MKIYLKKNEILIRSISELDAQIINQSFALQGWNRPVELLSCYFLEQERGQRTVAIAEVNGEFTGYVTLLPFAKEGPYSKNMIPEIKDLVVLQKFQNVGIGNYLMDVVEKIASEVSDAVSLSVGLHKGYGKAQRMYVLRGYVPDGSGVWFNGKQLEEYVDCVNDDTLN